MGFRSSLKPKGRKSNGGTATVLQAQSGYRYPTTPLGALIRLPACSRLLRMAPAPTTSFVGAPHRVCMEWPTFTPTALIPTPRPCMISGHVGGADRHGLCGQRPHLASPFDRSLVLRADRLLGARVKFVKNCQKMIHRYIGHSPKKIVKTFSKRCLPRVPDAYSKAGQFNPSDLPIYQSSSPQLWELLRHTRYLFSHS